MWLPYRTGELPLWLQRALFRSFFLQRIFYRYYCPYPLTHDRTARACVMSGGCGCENARRFR
jgi:hypothetical protein